MMKKLPLLIPQKFEIVDATSVGEMSKPELEWNLRKSCFKGAAHHCIDNLFKGSLLHEESGEECDPIESIPMLKQEYERVDPSELYGTVLDMLIELAENVEKSSPLARLLNAKPKTLVIKEFHNRYGLHVNEIACLKGANALFARLAIVRSLDAVRILHQRGTLPLSVIARESLEYLVSRDRQILSEDAFQAQTHYWHDDDLYSILKHVAAPVVELLSSNVTPSSLPSVGVVPAAAREVFVRLPLCSWFALCRAHARDMDDDLVLVRNMFPDLVLTFREAKAGGIARIGDSTTKEVSVDQRYPVYSLAEIKELNAAGIPAMIPEQEVLKQTHVNELCAMKGVINSYCAELEDPMFFGGGNIDERALQARMGMTNLEPLEKALKRQLQSLRDILVSRSTNFRFRTYKTNSLRAADAISKDRGRRIWTDRPDEVERRL